MFADALTTAVAVTTLGVRRWGSEDMVSATIMSIKVGRGWSRK